MPILRMLSGKKPDNKDKNIVSDSYMMQELCDLSCAGGLPHTWHSHRNI